MNKKIIFLVLSLLVSSCSSGNENPIDELEEQIEALENKQNLTPEEETELENLKTQAEESPPPPPEVLEFENEREATEFADLNDPIFSKYYTVGEPDPNYNPGKFLPRHCIYTGRYEDVFYEETPLLEVPFINELILDFYPETLGLYSKGLFPLNIIDYGGEHGDQLGEIKCIPDLAIATGIGGDVISTAANDGSRMYPFYGLSFYDRIFPFYSVRPEDQQGLWGQWIQAPNSHPYGPAGGTIEGGLGAYDKFGRTKYPIYMASGANLFYNSQSSYSGWGFYERRCACADFGGVQLTNKVLNLPNAIHFDEDQNEYAEDGGIYFGHGWFALPIFSGEERVHLDQPTTDIGKLTWTFVGNSAQYSGPMWAYVPEFWYRNIDVWNSFELLFDGAEDDEDFLGKEIREVLIDYIAGRVDNETLMEAVKSLGWYVDNADDYDFEEESGLFWVEEKNTLAYTSTPYAAIGAEMGELPVFTEYDENGDLYIKIFPPSVPSMDEKEYFTLDGRTYDIDLYNYFVDFFSGEAEIEGLDTSFLQFSKPMSVEKVSKERPDLKQNDLYMKNDDSNIEALEMEWTLSWNLHLAGETKKGETNTYWDWGGIKKEERNLVDYYKVEFNGAEKGQYSSYEFVPVNEGDVPKSLQMLEMSNLERTISYMPHIQSAQDKSFEAEVKENIDSVFDIDSDPYDYSCLDCNSEGCDPTIYETTLDDGTLVKYRWYRFKDQPTFMYLSIDYPEIYTEEYLDLLQSRIEKMHEEWGSNQEFIPTPKTLDNFHLVELDNGSVVEPPSGKEFGWVPIVLEVEIPYGKYQTEIAPGEFPCGKAPGQPDCPIDPLTGEEQVSMLMAGRVSPP